MSTNPSDWIDDKLYMTVAFRKVSYWRYLLWILRAWLGRWWSKIDERLPGGKTKHYVITWVPSVPVVISAIKISPLRCHLQIKVGGVPVIRRPMSVFFASSMTLLDDPGCGIVDLERMIGPVLAYTGEIVSFEISIRTEYDASDDLRIVPLYYEIQSARADDAVDPEADTEQQTRPADCQ